MATSRSEPRFETGADAVVDVIRHDGTSTLAGHVTDISGMGFRVELDLPLAVGENILLTVAGHQVFAVIRNCTAAASGFVVGVERVDNWQDIGKDGVAVPSRSPLGPVLKSHIGPLRAAALRELLGKKRVKTKRKSSVVPMLVAAALVAVLAGWAQFGTSRPVQSAAKPEAVVAERPSLSPVSETEPAQTETVAADNVVTQTAPKSSPAAVTPTPTLPVATTAPVTARPATLVAASTAPPSAPRPASPPAEKPNPSAGATQSISIKASNLSWVTACADGVKVLDKLFHEGDSADVPFTREAILRSGNAGALELTVGHQSVGSMGTWGQVRTVKATPAGYEFGSNVLSCAVQPPATK